MKVVPFLTQRALFHLAGKTTFRTPHEDDSTPNPNFRAEYEIYNPNG